MCSKYILCSKGMHTHHDVTDLDVHGMVENTKNLDVRGMVENTKNLSWMENKLSMNSSPVPQMVHCEKFFFCWINLIKFMKMVDSWATNTYASASVIGFEKTLKVLKWMCWNLLSHIWCNWSWMLDGGMLQIFSWTFQSNLAIQTCMCLFSIHW